MARTVRVLVFAKSGTAADAAREAGAEFVGFDDMIKKCQDGWTDFDVAVATPEAMVEVRKLGKVLGPRGLMPNPKTGTVTDDTAKAVREVKAGRVEFKVDKAGNVHVPVGKVDFEPTTDRGERAGRVRRGEQGAPSQCQGHVYPRLHHLGHHEPGGASGHQTTCRLTNPEPDNLSCELKRPI